MKNRFKKIIAVLLVVCCFALTACDNVAGVATTETSTASVNNSADSGNSGNSGNAANSGNSSETITQSVTPEPIVEVSTVTDAEISKVEIVSDFEITKESETGSYKKEGSTYIITAAGEYTLTGCLEDGNIIVDAGEDAEVNLNLNGVSISSTKYSPINVVNAAKVKIKSEEGSYNEVRDLRTGEVSEEEETGKAAIFAACDMNLTGKGTLVVSSTYNNGIHSKDDLTIKNVTLKVTAVNNAIKGNDAVDIESGNLLVISTGGDGIKTSTTTLSKKGNQKGTITISGGNVDIYACCDGIDAAYDAVISTTGNINIYTAKNSEYSGERFVSASDSTSSSQSSSSNNSGFGTFGGFGGRGGFGGGFGGGGNSNKSSYSAKGIKAGNEVIINNGTIYIKAYDDGIHADMETMESGVKGVGNVNVNGGTITIEAADDGIHAENVVNINDGYINVVTSYEGIEGNVININGGTNFIYASDDGLNACSGSTTPLINFTGGYTDVTTPSGDTDAIDSNGNITMTGGFVLVKGGNTQGNVAGSVDVDGSIKITSGYMVALGGICELPSNSANCYASRGTSFSSGSYELKDGDGNVILNFTLSKSYSSCWICSDKLETKGEYTLYKNETTKVLSWTQTSGNAGDASSSGFGGGGFGGGGKRK